MKEKIIEKLKLVYKAGVIVGMLGNEDSEEAENAEAKVCDIVADEIIKLYEDKEKEDLFPPVIELDDFIKRNIINEVQTCEYCGKEFTSNRRQKRCNECEFANYGKRPEEYDDEDDY